jgi:hypothetical protein
MTSEINWISYMIDLSERNSVVCRTEEGMNDVNDSNLLVMSVTLHDEGNARTISEKQKII